MDRQALAIGQRFKDIAARPVSEDSVFVLKRHQVYVVDLREILSTAMGSTGPLHSSTKMSAKFLLNHGVTETPRKIKEGAVILCIPDQESGAFAAGRICFPVSSKRTRAG